MRLVAIALTLSLIPIGCSGPSPKGHVFSVDGEKTLLDGEPFLVKGLRLSNALISEETADQLIDNLDVIRSYGVNTVSVFLMGSRFGDVKGYRRDGSLDPMYAARLSRIIDAADARGMVVLVGCLYWGNSKAKWKSWTQREAEAAVAATAAWLRENGHRNVFLDVDNKGMARREKGFDNRGLVLAAKAAAPDLMVATNFKGPPPEEADLAIHFAEKVAGKPYIQSEGTPEGFRYWGPYSKREGLYDYINKGVYSEEMKRTQMETTREHLQRGDGYMLASTWLQDPPPDGPHQFPGGAGSPDDPGIRWWLEFLLAEFGERKE